MLCQYDGNRITPHWVPTEATDAAEMIVHFRMGTLRLSVASNDPSLTESKSWSRVHPPPDFLVQQIQVSTGWIRPSGSLLGTALVCYRLAGEGQNRHSRLRMPLSSRSRSHLSAEAAVQIHTGAAGAEGGPGETFLLQTDPARQLV